MRKGADNYRVNLIECHFIKFCDMPIYILQLGDLQECLTHEALAYKSGYVV